MTTLPKLSELTEEQIRVMIAEARGWTDILNGRGFNRQLSEELNKAHDGGIWHTPIPPLDLNEMAKAEEMLTDHQFECYELDLWKLVNGDQPRQPSQPTRCSRAYFSASAIDRAKAVLLTLNLATL